MTPAVPGSPCASAPGQHRAAIAHIRSDSGSGVPGQHPSLPLPLPKIAAATVPGAA